MTGLLDDGRHTVYPHSVDVATSTITIDVIQRLTQRAVRAATTPRLWPRGDDNEMTSDRAAEVLAALWVRWTPAA